MKSALKMGLQCELTIERLGGLGDGVGRWGEREIFIPLTTPGDRVRARIVRVNNKMVRAELLELRAPGEDRVPAPCGHFGTCGGCDLQHLASERYFRFKADLLRQAVARAGYDPTVVAPVIAVPPGSRRRADFAVAIGGGKTLIGFRARGSHHIVDQRACPVLLPTLEVLREELRSLIPRLPWGGSVVGVLMTAVGESFELVLELAAPFSAGGDTIAQFAEDHDLARVAWKCGEFSGIIVQRRPLTITWGGRPVALPPGAFLQATEAGETAIREQILAATAGARTAVDLYAGCGAFTLPLLAAGLRVRAYEGSSEMVAALAAALSAEGTVVKRDLYRDPLPGEELVGIDCAVIDPPRNGAEPQMRELAVAGIARVVLVSCNPRALERDAALMRAAGYRLTTAVPIDQFLWSTHLESVAVFCRP